MGKSVHAFQSNSGGYKLITGRLNEILFVHNSTRKTLRIEVEDTVANGFYFVNLCIANTLLNCHQAIKEHWMTYSNLEQNHRH